MPELPEVETLRQQILPHVLNKRITKFSLHTGGENLIKQTGLALMRNTLTNNKFTDLKRHGKYLLFQLDGSTGIVAHLRMSGRFTITKGKVDTNKHNRLSITFDDDSHLNFIDIRRFANFELFTDQELHKLWQKLGPDALHSNFNVDYLQPLLDTKRSIYNVIMDQSIVAGLGNIYANEVLFMSKIAPTMPAYKASEDITKTIVASAKKILNKAIGFKGTTLIDKTFADINGGYGEFRYELNVYGRGGEKCKTCNTPVSKIKLGGRSVFFCPNCQQSY